MQYGETNGWTRLETSARTSIVSMMNITRVQVFETTDSRRGSRLTTNTG
jgi:hypothetical protein